MSEKRLHYAGRVCGEEEKEALHAAADEFWLTEGRWSAWFRRKLANNVGVPFISLVNSGSSANLLAVAALTQPELGEHRLKPGDEVLTTALCFPTTVTPLVQHGLVPKFLDVNLPGCNVDVDQLRAAITGRTRAVMLSHTCGNPFEAAEIKDVCAEKGLWLIEDNCDSLGSMHAGSMTGSFGDLSTLSFYPAHHITTGEGGAVCTSNELLLRLVQSLRDWGRDCYCPSGYTDICGARFTGKHGTLPEGYDHKYVYSRLGYNLKMTDLQAAVGAVQMDRLEAFGKARRENHAVLSGLLGKSRKLMVQQATHNSDPSWFSVLIAVKRDAGIGRNELVRALEDKGIETRMPFAGNITRQPCMRDVTYLIAPGGLPNTDYLAEQGFMVGCYPGLTTEDMERIGMEILALVEAHAYCC